MDDLDSYMSRFKQGPDQIGGGLGENARESLAMLYAHLQVIGREKSITEYREMIMGGDEHTRQEFWARRVVLCSLIEMHDGSLTKTLLAIAEQASLYELPHLLHEIQTDAISLAASVSGDVSVGTVIALSTMFLRLIDAKLRNFGKQAG